MSILAEVTGDHLRSTVCLPCTLRPEAVRVIPLGVGVGVTVGVTVGVGVGVGVGVAVGVGVGVAVAVGEGVGVGVPCEPGDCIWTVMGDPVLKKATVAFVVCGGWSASKRKVYNVPQRIAFAFGFCAKVSVLQVREFAV